MSSDSVKFSVLVPVYNTKKYLDQCITSVLCQSYPDFELILVDDGSSDGSLDVCKDFAKTDSRIIVLHQSNSGQFIARLTAIENASGDYCIFLDSDDYLEPNALEIARQNVEKYHSDCIVWGLKIFSDGRLKELAEPIDLLTPIVTEDKKEIIAQFFHYGNSFNSLVRKVTKTALLSNLRECSHEYSLVRHGEDLLFSLEIYRNVKSVVFTNAKPYVYVKHTDNITRKTCIDDDLLTTNAEYDFLQNEVGIFFTQDELSFLKLRSLNNFIKSINMLCRSIEYRRKDKVNLLKKMYESQFFSKVRSEHNKQEKKLQISFRLILFLFRRKAFASVIMINQAYAVVRKFRLKF